MATTLTLPGLLPPASDAIAILAPGREPLSYRRLHEQLDHVSSTLAALGVGRDDRVASALRNGPEAAAALAAFGSAATFAPLNPDQREAEFEYLLSEIKPRALLVEAGADSPAARAAATLGVPLMELWAGREAGAFRVCGAPVARPARRADPAPEDVALILCTSGTTGRPKLVPVLHRGLYLTSAWLVEELDLTAGDRCLNFSPLFHVLGINGGLLAPMAGGGSVVCAPAFHALEFFGWLDEFRPTCFSAVPTVHQAILERAPQHREILARLRIRFMRTGGSPLPSAVVAEIERTFHAPLLQVYGMTETPPITMERLPPYPRKPGSVGLRMGNAVAVLDAHGNRLPDGATGEIVVSGPAVTPGYLNNPAANRDVFHDGWFRTGDLGHFDADGFLFLTGRCSEFINRGGEKISPVEVDEVLLEHPAVAEAVTFAMPDAKLGEEVAAAVVPRAPITEVELQSFVAARIADHKMPRRVVLVPELPKGATGKMRRTGLAAALKLDAPPPAAGPSIFAAPRNERERKIASIWAVVLGLDRVGIHDNFFDVGGDSLLAAHCLDRVRAAMGLEKLPLTALLLAPTVAQLGAWLADPLNLRPAVRVVPIQPQGDKLPLFVVAPGLEHWRLARHLGPGQPVFGVDVPDLEDTPPPHTIEAMAAKCVQALRQFRPRGPYALCGWCLQGVIAFEMAQQLQALGEAVALLALIDARALLPPPRTGAQRLLIPFLHFGQQARYHARLLAGPEGFRHARQLAGGLADYWLRRLWQVAYGAYARRGRLLPKTLRSHHNAAIAALRLYHPAPYSGVLVHIWAERRPVGLYRNVDYCWGHLARGGIVFREAPGDHRSIFQEPSVAVLAKHLAEQLEAADSPRAVA